MKVNFEKNEKFFSIPTKIASKLIGKTTIFPLEIENVFEGGNFWIVRFHNRGSCFKVPKEIAEKLVTDKTSYCYNFRKKDVIVNGQEGDISYIPEIFKKNPKTEFTKRDVMETIEYLLNNEK